MKLQNRLLLCHGRCAIPSPASNSGVASCNFWFILVPSSDCFVDLSKANHVERSQNRVPYASMVQFA